MRNLLFIFLLVSGSAFAEVKVTAILGAPVSGVPVDEVRLWCDQVDGAPVLPVILLDMANLSHTYPGLPDGETHCTARVVSNNNIYGSTPRVSNLSPATVFEVKDGSPVKVPNSPGITITVTVVVN